MSLQTTNPAMFHEAQEALIGPLSYFMSETQRLALLEGLKGEEGAFFAGLILGWKSRIESVPQTYQTKDGSGTRLAHLHYFVGGCDWWIIEKDMGNDYPDPDGEQLQAYGLACLGDPEDAEYGYISLPELFENGAELDLYYSAEPTANIFKRLNGG